MLIGHFDVKGLVQFSKKFISLLGIEQVEKERALKKRAELWITGNWFSLHDNTPAPTALSAQ